MTTYNIPLTAEPQSFNIALAGVTYGMSLQWCAPASCWILDISDASGNPLVSGIPLVTGADLLEPYGYLGFGGQLIAGTDYDTAAVPTFDNLGTTGYLHFVTR